MPPGMARPQAASAAPASANRKESHLRVRGALFQNRQKKPLVPERRNTVENTKMPIDYNAPTTLAGPEANEHSLDSVKFIMGCLLLRQALSEVVGTRVLRDGRYHFNRDLDHRICEAGRLLDVAGGMEAMQIVYYNTLADVCPRVPHVARSVEALWDGIGQWKL